MFTQDTQTAIVNSLDFKDLINRIRRAEAYADGWHKNIERWRKLYNMKHYNMPGKVGEILYNDPTYTNTVDLAVGIMLGNDLKWHAYGFSPSIVEQKVTGKMEKLIDGILNSNAEREETHLLYQLFLNFNRDGGGVIYSVFDPMLADAFKDQVAIPDGTNGVKNIWKFSEVPIRMKVIDPLSVIFLPGGPKKWLLIGRKEARSVLDVETMYNVRLPRYATMSQEEKATTMGVFHDVWDYVWINTEAPAVVGEDTKALPEPGVRKIVIRNSILFDFVPIRPMRVMDGYKELPYTMQFFKPVGDQSNQWHSILSPLESSVAMLERSFNRRAKQIDVFTALPLIAKTLPGRKVVIDPGLYNSVTIAPDESIEFPRWPGNAPDVQVHQDFLRSRIQQSGFSDVMFGSGNNQVAGYALSQLGDQNRIRLEQPIQHLELLLTTWAKKTISLLRTYAPGTRMCVYGKIRGSDYMDEVDMNEVEGYTIRAEIRPNFPNEEMRRVAMATQTKGTLSDYTRMEKYLGIEQPEDENKRKIIEQLQLNPLTQQYVMTSVLKEAADAGDETARLVLESMQNQGMPGTPGRPPEPNKPEQPMGTPGPTGAEPVPGEPPPGTTPTEIVQKQAMAAPNNQGVVNNGL